MSVLVIKNLPEEVHERLKKRAARNHRSLTREAIAVLEAAVNAPEPAAMTMEEKLAALFKAGEAMKARGVDFEAWAASSRDVWR